MYWKINAPDIAQRYYHYDPEEGANTAILAFKHSTNPRDGKGYLCAYQDCDYDWITSPGGISIDKVELVDGVKYVTGSVVATGYRTEGVCNIDWRLYKVNVSGSFRLQVITAD